MNRISRQQAGLMLGALLGGWHLIWAIALAAGWGQPLLDLVFWMHFLKPAFTIGGFSLDRAIVLVAVTTAGGYSVGYAGAAISNRLHPL